MTASWLEQAFAEERGPLFGLCYRMTGCAADADDLVQQTFIRAMARPPSRERPVGPWLQRVAVNLSIDFLRARKRRGYVGPWLPGPIEKDRTDTIVASDDASPEAQYSAQESISFAFLIALEALEPQQRAVLLLRDVLGYSVREASATLELSEPNIKTTLHRAKKQMAAYDSDRFIPTEENVRAHEAMLGNLFQSFAMRDVDQLAKLLRQDVVALSDGADEFHAAKVPVVGLQKVSKFYLRLLERRGAPIWFDLRRLNGVPAVLSRFGTGLPKEAADVLTWCQLDAEGRVSFLGTVLATRKLAAVEFPAPLSPKSEVT